jgi:hypothetical protein
LRFRFDVLRFNHVIATHFPLSFVSCELPYLQVTCICISSHQKIILPLHVTTTHAAAGLQSLSGRLFAMVKRSPLGIEALSTCLLACSLRASNSKDNLSIALSACSEHTTTTRSVRSHTHFLLRDNSHTFTLSHTEKRKKHNDCRGTGLDCSSKVMTKGPGRRMRHDDDITFGLPRCGP